ncbi:rod-binding protein [Actibacterium sp. XHP0104]|uniref:rod-binding protein n=1 Tax=Actibacterium sp. XHP0104 TaxID=2984335 RepID=UPI0021E80C32|nr:rod-binding protein [Actibacterium sp. XHP0104]MCV2881792.1 rod-binding protein [Actibacterium sp. XHP0104]
MSAVSPLPPPLAAHKTADHAALRTAAEELEAVFLTEMLKSAGVGKTPEAFGGGAGEDQFASFLRQEQARAMVKAGGIGLAEHLFNALKERVDD